ncbi:MAG TPA: 2-hydroxychromene-2-carboxylate isomerase [Aestuariivirgaceae bacterium]|nr:2-hydroxychromene-2-carboxylate isomerase [Aestuariivirgaceae bacterium]
MDKPTDEARGCLDLWFDLASTYSYLTAMRIVPLAMAADVDVRWRPFLLGPIFKARGWDTSPFNLYPDKGRYMWRDMERLAQAQGLALVRPEPFPQNSLLAARAALSPAVAPHQAAFCRGVFAAEFAEGQSISEPTTLAGIAAGLGLDAEAILAEATSGAVKERLKEETTEAQRLGIFGAPTFVAADGELFWGNDRLEHALAWVTRA